MGQYVKINPADFVLSVEAERFRVESSAPHMPVIEEAYSIGAQRKWFVIQTNPKCEAKASDRIEKEGASFYLPKQKVWGKRDQRTNKMARLIKNLMPGYLFAYLPQDGWFDRIRCCDGVCRIVSFSGAPEPVPETFIHKLKTRESTGEFDYTKRRRAVRNYKSPFPEWVFPGAIVRVVDVPFGSFMAQIESAQSGRLKCRVMIFGRQTLVELELAQVERIC